MSSLKGKSTWLNEVVKLEHKTRSFPANEAENDPCLPAVAFTGKQTEPSSLFPNVPVVTAWWRGAFQVSRGRPESTAGVSRLPAPRRLRFPFHFGSPPRLADQKRSGLSRGEFFITLPSNWWLPLFKLGLWLVLYLIIWKWNVHITEQHAEAGAFVELQCRPLTNQPLQAKIITEYLFKLKRRKTLNWTDKEHFLHTRFKGCMFYIVVLQDRLKCRWEAKW